MNPPPIPEKRSRRGLLIAVVILGVALGMSICVNLAVFVGRNLKNSDLATLNGGSDQFPKLVERWSYGHGDVKVARIHLDGVIIRHEPTGLLGARVDKIQEIVYQVRAATNDKDVRAIVFEIDSPGGAVTPSDELYRVLNSFRESRSDRRVIAFAKDLAASGGYYAAMSADWIIAQPTSVVGSIGVIMQSLNWKKLTDDIGIRDITIKSGKNKDLLNPFRETSDEHLGILQNMIDSMHARFKGIVQESRNIDTETLNELADGRVYTAEQALDYHLIDQVGYWEDVVDRTSEVLGVESVRFIKYYRHTDFFTLLTQIRTPWHAPSLMDLQSPRIMYLWKP